MGPCLIADYGLIGDGRSAALVSRAGSIDWLCWPRFDSGSIFAAALDPERGGTFRIAPVDSFETRRAYADSSNVLVTCFETAGGEATLTDAMTVLDEDEKRTTSIPEHELLRLIECTRGEITMDVVFEPRPDYGRKALPLRQSRTLGLRLKEGPALYTLRSDGACDLVGERRATGRFTLRAGERRAFSLTYDSDAPAILPPLGDAAAGRMARTVRWWQGWAKRSTYGGPYREIVSRSLLTLKLLSYAPTGAIVAAPTTSLPEKVGGSLNWDYRYCWLRDASMAVRTYLELGYTDEANAFVSWLLHTTRLTRPELRILYDVYGTLPDDERILSHLEGYRGSVPVRIGNAAATQLQLDTYGEVIDAVTQLSREGAALDRETQQMLREFGHYVCRNWPRPDQGIWEPRDAPAHYTHSRLLCWRALDRLLALNARGCLPRIPRSEYQSQRAAIREQLEKYAWNPSLQSYAQRLVGETVDASLLLFCRYGLFDPRDPRMGHTFHRIRERLSVGPGLLLRYEESRAAGEGAFGICSFWAAELLAQGGGTLDEAERWFQSVLPYANDLGLFAEEVDLDTGEPLGNFPQAYTHVGLLSAALAIEARRGARA